MPHLSPSSIYENTTSSLVLFRNAAFRCKKIGHQSFFVRPLVALFRTSSPDSPLEQHLLALRKLFDQCIIRWRGKDISPCKERIDLIQRYHIDLMPPPPTLDWVTCRSNNPATAVHFTSLLSQPIWLCSPAHLWRYTFIAAPSMQELNHCLQDIFTARQRSCVKEIFLVVC